MVVHVGPGEAGGHAERESRENDCDSKARSPDPDRRGHEVRRISAEMAGTTVWTSPMTA